LRTAERKSKFEIAQTGEKTHPVSARCRPLKSQNGKAAARAGCDKQTEQDSRRRRKTRKTGISARRTKRRNGRNREIDKSTTSQKIIQ
jgi:hypothetical protein